jgi:hypothetical protein
MIGGINIDNKNLSFFETVNKLCGEKKTIGSFFKATITVLFSSKSNIIAKLNANANTAKTDLNKTGITVATPLNFEENKSETIQKIKPTTGSTNLPEIDLPNSSETGSTNLLTTGSTNLPEISSIEDISLRLDGPLTKHMNKTHDIVNNISDINTKANIEALSEALQSLTTLTKSIIDVLKPYIDNPDKKKAINSSHTANLSIYFTKTKAIMRLIPEAVKKDETLLANFKELQEKINQLDGTWTDIYNIAEQNLQKSRR